MTIDERLREGHATFKSSQYEADCTTYQDLADNGQTPHTLVITCSDSRIVPHHILSAGPGDLFVVRNVAAMVPAQSYGQHGAAAAIEYAVTALGVANIVVIGHSGCGGVASVIDDSVPHDSFVGQWMAPLRDWLSENDVLSESTPADRKTWLEKASVNVSIDNLHSFPFVSERVEGGSLSVKGLLFNLHSGELAEVNAGPDLSFSLSNILT